MLRSPAAILRTATTNRFSVALFGRQSGSFELPLDVRLSYTFLPEASAVATIFGLIFIQPQPRSRAVSRIYVKNLSHHDYPGIAEQHPYISAQAIGLAEFHIDRLVADLEILRIEGRRLFEEPGEQSS